MEFDAGLCRHLKFSSFAQKKSTRLVQRTAQNKVKESPYGGERYLLFARLHVSYSLDAGCVKNGVCRRRQANGFGTKRMAPSFLFFFGCWVASGSALTLEYFTTITVKFTD